MKEGKRLVTIGIPFYNAEKYLDLAIKSILSQSFANWKLILLDDGSTDNSLKIAQSYEKDERIIVLSDGLNKNLPFRLNEIIEICDTKYLARMDADDIMHPDRIKEQLEILESNSKIDVLGTNAYSIDEYGKIQGVRKVGNWKKPKLISVNTFTHPTIMGKSSWFKQNRYDPKAIRMEDFELWNRTYGNSCFMAYTKPLLYYREFGEKYYRKYFGGIKATIYTAFKLNKIRLYKTIFTYTAKGLLYFVANKFDKEHKLIERRYTILDETDQNSAQKILDGVIEKND